MDLTDAGLRERARQVAAKWCADHSIVPNGVLASDLTEDIYIFGDAARAEQRETITALMRACDELMTEYVSKRRAADWGVINDAMVAGAAAIRARAQGGE